jgi:pimeloyl-ACP methyl ester carboxylesterase
VKVIALHGFSMNGAVLRAGLNFLQEALPGLELVTPDAPHACPADVVDRLYAKLKRAPQPPPHFVWWRASDDGREYRGWEATRGVLRSLFAEGPIGVIGFSQGAIAATVLAAMGTHGEMPPIKFAILIAGRPPRADVFQPFLTRPIAVPSLHVWGEHDALVGDGPSALVQLFSPAEREVATWPGRHSIPATGPAADAIVDFVSRRAR